VPHSGRSNGKGTCGRAPEAFAPPDSEYRGGDGVTAGRGRVSRFAPLRNRNFRLLLIGQTTSALGDAMVPIALSFAILADGGTALDIGLVFGTVAVAELALFLVGGVAADRHSRRMVMVLADAVRGASQLALAGLLIAGHPPIFALCACAGVQGVAGSFFSPAERALLPEVVGPGELQSANGLTQIASSAAGVLGPAVAGVLVVTIGGGWAIAINGASYAVNAALLTQIRARERGRKGPAGVLSQMREGWSVFVAIDWYVTIACAFSLVQVFVGVYFSVGPVVAKEYLGGAGAWAAILTVGGIGSAVGGAALIHVQPRRPLAAAMLFAVPFCLMPLAVALTLPVPVLCALSAIAGVGVLLMLTLFGTVVQRVVAPEVIGRVYAIDLSLSQIGLPLGLLLGGLLAPVLGPRTVLAAAGVGGAAMCVLTAALGPIRRMRLAPVDVDLPAG
jgi:MFS family permease